MENLLTSIGKLTRQFEDLSTHFVRKDRDDYSNLEFDNHYRPENGQHDRDNQDDDHQVYCPQINQRHDRRHNDQGHQEYFHHKDFRRPELRKAHHGQDNRDDGRRNFHRYKGVEDHFEDDYNREHDHSDR